MSINFKSEEEVKEYLERLGIEYRFGCFSEKNPEVCHLLGEYLRIIKKDYQKASRIFKVNCDDENYPRSCHDYAKMLLTGQGVQKRDEKLAFDYFLKACSLNVGASCFEAGLMTMRPLQNQIHEKDYTKGISLLDKSCQQNYVRACYYLSGLYITGGKDFDNAIEKDMKQAFKYSEKACNLNHLNSCINLSIMYRKGEGVEKNEEMANKVSKKVEELKEELRSSAFEFQRGTKPF